MSQEQWNEVDRYICDALVPDDDALTAALQAVREAGMPEISVAANQGRMLQILAASVGAKRILEVGTLGGYSTIWLARALPADGQLITLEVSAKHAHVARSNIERAGLGRVVDVRVGPAAETLPVLAAEAGAPFELVFIDADKPSNALYFDWAMKLTRPGSLIVIDNVVRGGGVADANSSDADVLGVRRLNERIAAEPRAMATAVQTVGSKGWDGFCLVLVG
jgi:predicted O-methyltransferase YrrM